MASLFKRKNGFFYVVFMGRNGQRTWRSTGERDSSAAEKMVGMLTDGLERPRWMNLSRFVREILDHVKNRLAPGTVSIYERSFRSFISVVGDRRLDAISPKDVEIFMNTRIRSVSKRTANIDVRTLKAAFRKAVEWGYLAESPFQFVKQFSIAQRDPLFLTVEEFRRLLTFVKDQTLRDIFLFAALTMMRLGEIMALTWQDVDLAKGTARVRNSDTFTVKTRKPRTVPLNREICAILLRRKTEKITDKVFLNNGKPFDPKYVSQRFKRYVRKAGLNPKYHFHTLRHTGASWLAQAGVSLLTIQKVLGHSTPVITQIYAHLNEDVLRSAVETLSVSPADHQPIDLHQFSSN